MTEAKIVLKEGVEGTMAPPIEWASEEAAIVYGWFGIAEMVITAIRDGQHKLGSLHARGYAIDIRTLGLPPGGVPAILATLKARLGACFDIVLENSTTPGASAAHIHIEFDPEHDGGTRLPIAA